MLAPIGYRTKTPNSRQAGASSTTVESPPAPTGARLLTPAGVGSGGMTAIGDRPRSGRRAAVDPRARALDRDEDRSRRSG